MRDSAGPQMMAGFDIGDLPDEAPEAIAAETEGPSGASGGASVPVNSGESGVEVKGAQAPDIAGSGSDSVGEPTVVPPVDACGVSPVPTQVADGSTASSESDGRAAGVPIGVPGVLKESPLGGVNPAGEEASHRRGRSDDRSLGEKISGIHNTAAQVQQHLPEDSATVSAPTLNIQHGE